MLTPLYLTWIRVLSSTKKSKNLTKENPAVIHYSHSKRKSILETKNLPKATFKLELCYRLTQLKYQLVLKLLRPPQWSHMKSNRKNYEEGQQIKISLITIIKLVQETKLALKNPVKIIWQKRNNSVSKWNVSKNNKINSKNKSLRA